MSEKPNPTDQENSDAENQSFGIQKIYVKDISFETPNSPDIFTQKWEPIVNLELSTSGNLIENNVHEVILTLTISVKLKEKTAYLIEAQQAGLFSIQGFEEKELAHALGSFCPNILFPFARELVSDMVIKGGFPQLLLAPVNFDALFAQHMQQLQQQDQGTKPVH